MTTVLRLMPDDRLGPWIARSQAAYEQSRLASGEPAEIAAEAARASFEQNFPGGRPAPGHLVHDVVVTLSGGDGGVAGAGENSGSGGHDTVVGVLWIGPFAEGSDAWWVWDVEIDERHRGAGHGRAAMQLAEEEAARHGAATLGLNVFGYNTAARALYESLGYETTAVQMRKPVGSSGSNSSSGGGGGA
ncbi:GNAT family N-acetyltransferase [Frigoribacterium sp. CFBP 8766]|uniref:GNAT family N-acetyltransferase n=1 Tax=Frigoribacterium sp. CFBP 8766 TaxID=2775273 RepID=UPI0017874DA3|nr:GNAT family N-acetyltransferase [Frigoribacterium sp. CFBP 8766]MBD8585740.1 GNAT family N-acetyltransferase [Frigoribacterium sp. CFBP 8766]